MVKRTILIVDDEPVQCKIMKKFISGMGHNYLIMNSGIEVVDFFVNKKIIEGFSYSDIDVMLLDLSMPDLDGLAVLKKISSIRHDVQVIVLTATTDVNLAITSINLGATDYIIKGKDDIFSRVTASIKNAIDKKNLKYQVSNLARKDQNQVSFSDIIGKSDAILSVISTAKKAISVSIPVLIGGQNGSGKELLARSIHGSGSRSGKNFVTVDCDMINPADAEEIIFGNEKNTNSRQKICKIKEAEGGTIFFKKIDSLTVDIQSKILRLIQDGEYFSQDSSKPASCNVRVMASTNKDLKKLSLEKKFREDLRYAISIFPIMMPSLKDRRHEDIIMLAEYFLRTFVVNENKKIKQISESSIKIICDYDWKDNVRQLKNYIFRAVILCDSEQLLPEHFPQILNDEIFSESESLKRKKVFFNMDGIVEIFDDNGKCKNLSDIEEEISQKLMKKFNGNISEVAKQLNIARSTLYRKLKLDDEDIIFSDKIKKN